MKKTWIRAISLIIISLLVLSGIAVAEDVGTAEIVFSATEKENDIVELDVIVKNATFMGIQTALSYDKRVLVPVDENGEETTKFNKFAKKMEDGFNTIGLDLDIENGFFGFTLYIMPGTEHDNINSHNEYAAGEEGVNLYKFRFKKIKEEKYSFKVISSKETDYAPAIESGLQIMNYAVGGLTSTISFVYDNKETEQTTITPVRKPQKPVEEEPEFTSLDRKKDAIMLQIGKSLAVSHNRKVKIDPDDNRVVPYITNDRTLIPIRFVAENLGAEVLWEEGWKYCIIKKDDKEIKLNFNSAEFEVNGEKVVFDAPVELKFDRTMVPLRFVSEQLGLDVYWNELNKAVVLSPADNPWQKERQAEITAFNEMLITISGMLP